MMPRLSRFLHEAYATARFAFAFVELWLSPLMLLSFVFWDLVRGRGQS